VAEGRVQRTVAHPGYDPATPVSPQNVRHDVALLELAQPIPAAVAAPYSVVSPGKGTAVSVLSYAEGREDVPSWQRECQVLDRAEGLVALDCDVSFGSSGAPVFDRSGPRPRIVSLISAGGPTDKGAIAYGMDLPGAVRDLKKGCWRPTVLAGRGQRRDQAAPKTQRRGSPRHRPRFAGWAPAPAKAATSAPVSSRPSPRPDGPAAGVLKPRAAFPRSGIRVP
jgi:protease YdgD